MSGWSNSQREKKTRRNKKIQIIFVFENWFRSTFSLLVRFLCGYSSTPLFFHQVERPFTNFTLPLNTRDIGIWFSETFCYYVSISFRLVQFCGCIPYTWLNLLNSSVSKCNRYRQVRQVKTHKNCAHNDRSFFTCFFFVTWVMSSERNASRNLNWNNWIFSNHNWNRCIYVWNVVKEENPLLKFQPCFESNILVFSTILIHSEPIGNFLSVEEMNFVLKRMKYFHY